MEKNIELKITKKELVNYIEQGLKELHTLLSTIDINVKNVHKQVDNSIEFDLIIDDQTYNIEYGKQMSTDKITIIRPNNIVLPTKAFSIQDTILLLIRQYVTNNLFAFNHVPNNYTFSDI
jgi:hypothetical protein